MSLDSSSTSEKTSLSKEKAPERVHEIDKSLEKNIVDLLCNTLLNLPISIEDVKDALQKVSVTLNIM